LCTEEIEIKTDMELSSCSPEEDENVVGLHWNRWLTIFFIVSMTWVFWIKIVLSCIQIGKNVSQNILDSA
jgi:hypothetical protein